jgi:tryptophan-rich sensory protein
MREEMNRPLPSLRAQVLGLVAWLALAFAASAVGAVASIQARSFYSELAQPGWAPPGSIFGPVWTLLYALMGVAAWWVWRAGGFRNNRAALTVFLLQLALNALWSWLFFAWHLGFIALAELFVLWILILATLVSFWRVRPLAGALFIPYLLWVSFAAVLNYSLWQLNPQIFV